MLRYLVVALALLLPLAGCSRGNGLPADLTRQLAAHGIHVKVTASQAALSSRGGFIVFARDPAVEAKIVGEFGMERIEQQDPRFGFIADRITKGSVAMWGIGSRSAVLKLEHGAQFEYLYLLTTDGGCYLVAEYAYG